MEPGRPFPLRTEAERGQVAADALAQLMARQRGLRPHAAAPERPVRTILPARRARVSRQVAAVAAVGVTAALTVTLAVLRPWGGGRLGSTGPADTQPAAAQTDSTASLVPAVGTLSGLPAAHDTGGRVPVRPLVVELTTFRLAWIRAVVDGQETFGRIVPAGETIALEANASVTLRLGDAGAVRVRVNGEDRGLAGRDGEVLTRRFDVPGVGRPPDR
jgi:hypothetical protein